MSSDDRRALSVAPEEVAWRKPEMWTVGRASGLQLTRWRSAVGRTGDCDVVAVSDRYIAEIPLRSTDMRLSVSGRCIQDGPTFPGMFHISDPDDRVEARFRSSYDTLHLFISTAFMAECVTDLVDPSSTGARPRLAMREVIKDPVVEAIARALFDADLTGGAFGAVYADSLSTALLARMLHSSRSMAFPTRSRAAALAKWRLRRATDFIEANLDRSLGLGEIADAAGLSRMHFAAQFRAATGLRPHEYVMRRRIEQAQDLLSQDGLSIVEIALSVGFQTHSHFTSVFKRLVGQTPLTWRRISSL